jgi:hypothetical protein
LLLLLPALAQDGAASLTGEVKDITGAGVSGTLAELQLASTPESKFRTSADSVGSYRFSAVPSGEYTLKLQSPGFRWATIKSIRILEGEQESLPTLRLEVGSVADCGGHAVLDFLRLLPAGDQNGDLAGSVRVDQKKKPPPIAGVDVALMCSAQSLWNHQDGLEGGVHIQGRSARLLESFRSLESQRILSAGRARLFGSGRVRVDLLATLPGTLSFGKLRPEAAPEEAAWSLRVRILWVEL